MNCRRARGFLTAGRASSGAARRHVESCEDCAGFARRLAGVERALSVHHAGVGPPAGFVARLKARLSQGEELIGWAALRLLPATLGLILLLSWLNLRGSSSAAPTETTDPTEAVLTWVLSPSSEIDQIETENES